MGIVVGGIRFERPPESDKELNYLFAEVANRLVKELKTTQDVYWFVIEQYDAFVSYGHEITSQIEFPFALYEIEYKGRKSENSYVGTKNPGMLFLDAQYMNVMIQQYGQKHAEYGRGLMFALLCSKHEIEINRLRMEYAVHYHNNCVSTSSWNFAEKWKEVIVSLGGD